MNQNVLLLAAVPVTGFIAGFINTLAGSGSLITLPLRLIGVLMLVMLVVMLLKPERWIAEHASRRGPRLWIEVPLFFAIGMYGGFLQAGVGIFLLAALVLGAGFNLVGANGAGQAAGAWVAARVALERGAAFVRIFVIAVVLLSAGALFAGRG